MRLSIRQGVYCALIVSLTACGGGGSSSKPTPASSSSLASSAPISSVASSVASSAANSSSSVLASSIASSNASSVASSTVVVVSSQASSSSLVSSSVASSSPASSSVASSSISSSSLSSSSAVSSSSVASSSSIASSVASSSSSLSSVSSSSSSSSTTLVGTAAVGVPISGTVVAIDINGVMSPAATTTAEGAFVVNVNGMTAPFILTITGTANGRQVSLNSIATNVGQTVNITPLTDLIVSTAAGTPGEAVLAASCVPVSNVVPQACLNSLAAATSSTNLSQAVTAVKNMIAPLNTAGTDPITGSFTANGTGMDALLDKILVSPALNLGETATVTLIATKTTIGQVALPASAGGSATPTATPPSTQDVTLADASGTAFNEIRACLDTFNALYPTTNFTAPAASRVGEFFDSSFSVGVDMGKADIVAALSDSTQMAVPGFGIFVSGFSPYDMSPLTSGEIATLSSSLSAVGVVKARSTSALSFTNSQATSAWVKVRFGYDSGLVSMKMLKGSPYSGCAGGWTMAGTQHGDIHMNARIGRNIVSQSSTIYKRTWPFHIEKEDAIAENAAVTNVQVRGPGLVQYGGSVAPVGAAAALTLSMGGEFDTEMVIGNGTSFYGHADAIQSCKDLVSTNAAVGTPCIDETQVAPGKLYSWALRDINNAVLIAFPFQISAVPLSTAFAEANASSLFATLTKVTPANITAVNSAINAASVDLDGVFSFEYTQQAAVYGSHMDNCRIGLNDANWSSIFVAEVNAVGSETGCTFTTANLNSGSLDKPVGAPAHGYVSVATSVLGNQAVSSQSYAE